MECIRLNNIIFYAHHGYFKAERELGQKFELDVELECRLTKAIETDSLEYTINYRTIFKRVKEMFNGSKFVLLETLAERIAKDLLENFDIHSARIRVRKPQVRLDGFLDNVEVEVFRKKRK